MEIATVNMENLSKVTTPPSIAACVDIVLPHINMMVRLLHGLLSHSGLFELCPVVLFYAVGRAHLRYVKWLHMSFGRRTVASCHDTESGAGRMCISRRLKHY